MLLKEYYLLFQEGESEKLVLYRKFAIGRPVQEVNVSIIDHGPNRLPDRL